MNRRAAPRILSIPAGAAFLPTLAEELLHGRLVPGFEPAGDPLALADATIYVPTRRAARALRSQFVDSLGGASAILPVIRPLGDFDEDAAIFDDAVVDALDLAPPIEAMDRLLALAPLVRAWKRRLPAHVAQLFHEDVVVPASTADSIWLARDLAALMDEIETEGVTWAGMATLVEGDLAAWWQVTLDFLEIVTSAWPEALHEMERSNPAAHRNALIDAEAARLSTRTGAGPVIAAGSTGSIPATARLLGTVARMPMGAVVLPGLDLALDDASWTLIGESRQPASAFGHPQYGLKKLLAVIGAARGDVVEIGRRPPALAARDRLMAEALRPAETTDRWADRPDATTLALDAGALHGVSLIEAANEREEALAIAVALRAGMEDGASHVALVTGDRPLARRVSAELLRFGIRADDSGGTPLARTLPGSLLTVLLSTVFEPGAPASILALLKHPFFRLGLERGETRRLAELAELVVLRGGTGRPDAASLAGDFDRRLAEIETDPRKPFWWNRWTRDDLAAGRQILERLSAALSPLTGRRNETETGLAAIARATVETLENLVRGGGGDVALLYDGDSGEALAGFLRRLVETRGDIDFPAREWPEIVAALMAGETVKPSAAGDSRVSIWGALEARLQSVDLMVVGGMNEGVWPRKAEADRFMSRFMKSGLDLEPPERRIGLAAHDFAMAAGAPRLVLSRSARQGDAPAVASRWLQRLLAVAGDAAATELRARGNVHLAWARALDRGPDVPYVARPCPTPPLAARPARFSVTEVETLRRDPYAIYARRVLGLFPLEPLVRDPGAAERGNLFHDILHRFTESGADPLADSALERLLANGRESFAAALLPADVEAVWWPRFAALAPNILAEVERARAADVASRHAEAYASPIAIAATGTVLSGRADRIDRRRDGRADILDYKTGSSPSRRQAHMLVSPQLALEAALLARGAFAAIGAAEPAELAYVRLKASGEVAMESILAYNRASRLASELAEDAWSRLERLVAWYLDPSHGYLSRALPFREGDMSGDYDHLARTLEWSAGADAADGAE